MLVNLLYSAAVRPVYTAASSYPVGLSMRVRMPVNNAGTHHRYSSFLSSVPCCQVGNGHRWGHQPACAARA